MKRKKLFVAALAVCTLLSCTKEVEVIKEVPIDGGGTEEGTSLVRFTLDANMVKTRASGDHYSSTPIDDEYRIYNYALFIFKSNGMIEAALAHNSGLSGTDRPAIDANGDNVLTFDPAQNQDLTWDGDAIVISAGMKTFFAIVNAPKEFVDEQNSFLRNKTLTLTELREQTLSLDGTLEKIVGSYNSGDVYYNNPVNNGVNRGFMMTNIITPSQTDGFYRQRLDETGDNDAPANIKVTVGRAMAKVSLASDLDSYTTITGTTKSDPAQLFGTLEVEAYRLINNPNEMNVALDIKNGILRSPYFENTGVNPNNYFTSNNTSQESNGYYIPVSKSPDLTFGYCVENTNQTPRYGNTAIALIKGYYTPLTGDNGNAVIMDADLNVSSTSLAEKTDFWRIWIPEYDDGPNSLGGHYAPEFFTADLTAAQLDAYKAAQNPAIPASVQLKTYAYPEGECYYYLPLKNEDNEGSPYSVYRNSYYKIDIKSVDGPGFPVDPNEPGEPGGPDKPGPEVPIEAQTNIKAAIKVAHWDEVNQEGNL